MFHKIAIFIIILSFVLLQFSFFPYFSTSFIPEITFILIIFLSARKNFNSIWPVVVLAGIMMDFFSFQPLGTHVIIYSLVSFGISYFAKRFLFDFGMIGFLATLAFVAAGTIISGLFFDWKSFFNAAPWLAGRNLFYQVIINAGMFVILYIPMRKMENILGYSKERKLAIK